MSTTSSHHAAVDLGAESGRVILGTLSQGRLSVSESNGGEGWGIEVGPETSGR
jgi:hypothetical protein